ncbi:MAG: hypothetical protein M3N68_08210 [Actinomycetota bacterium]|nr:hypothetical protein [Actinomycetota bacterium]
MRAAGLVVMGLMAALALSACGDGDGDEPLTKAGFIAEGNRICAETQQAVDTAVETSFPNKGNVPTATEAEQFVDGPFDDLVQRELDQLEELEPPEQDRERVDQMLEAGRRGLEEIKTNAVLVLNQDRNPLNRYAELASDYGLEACGRFSDDAQKAVAGIG